MDYRGGSVSEKADNTAGLPPGKENHAFRRNANRKERLLPNFNIILICHFTYSINLLCTLL